MTIEKILEEKSKDLVYRTKLIETKDIPFDPDLQDYCKANHCGSYGTNYACPPHVGKPEALIKKAKSYSHAFVFQTVSELEDSFDFEGMSQAKKNHTKAAETLRKVFQEKQIDHLALTAGACEICKTCTAAEEKPCRFPDRAISSLEAYCMHVAQLAEVCEMNYINGKDTVTYFGAFLFDQT